MRALMGQNILAVIIYKSIYIYIICKLPLFNINSHALFGNNIYLPFEPGLYEMRYLNFVEDETHMEF